MSGKNKRIQELKALRDNPGNLTAEQYLEILCETQKVYLINLFLAGIAEEDHNPLVCSNVLDKVHWMIDSAEKKAPQQKINQVDLGWDYATNDLSDNTVDA